MNPLCFLDLETTGVDREKDRIVQIAIIWRESKELGNFISYVNPEIPIPKGAIDIHGITDETVCNAPTFAEIAGNVMMTIGGKDIAGFNSLNFDVPLLFNELKRVGVAWDWKKHALIDVGNIMKRANPRTLEAACEMYLGMDHGRQAHAALDDAVATMKVFEEQQKRHELPTDRNKLMLYSNFDKPLLDITGKFTTNEHGEIVFNFGKHIGLPITDSLDYLEWMLKKDFPEDAKDICREALQTEQRNRTS